MLKSIDSAPLLAELFCPDLLPGEVYDLASIVAPVPGDPELPLMAIRIAGMPDSAPSEQVESWVRSLKRVAAAAGAAMAGVRR